MALTNSIAVVCHTKSPVFHLGLYKGVLAYPLALIFSSTRLPCEKIRTIAIPDMSHF
jgi:hypothetical protein